MKINTFKLEEYLSKYEFSAPYLLCCSDAESFSMLEVINMAGKQEQKLWQELRLGYTEVRGLPILRENITNRLYPSLKMENILCFAGAEDGIFCALSTLLNKNDHAIVLTPCYQSLLEIPKLVGANVSTVELKEENQWKINIDDITKEINPNTKIIIINFPHNPTGQVINQEELNALIALCKKHDLWLFSDEVYRLLGTTKAWAKPAAECYEKAISLGVMSKAFGMAGLRVGWIACQNQEVLQQLEQTKHYTSICNSAPSEILSLITIANMENILKRNNKIIEENLKELDLFFKKYQNLFSWVKPQGGCVGFVSYKGPQSIDIFCQKLVDKQGVLLMPASIYSHSSNHFRIAFGRKNMPDALQRLEDFIKNEI
jgi:aspartate/methionine/tyrosine aminotransferase